MSQYLDKVFLYLLISGNKGHNVLLFLGVNYGNKDEVPLEGKKLLDIVRDKIRFKHYSIKTEKSFSFPRCIYNGWNEEICHMT